MTSRPVRFSLFVCAALAWCASARASAPTTAAPQAGKSAGFALSRNVRDLPSVRPDPDSPLPAEWIRDNERLPRSQGPFPNVSTPDGALQHDAAAFSASPAMPSPSRSTQR